MSRVLVLYTGGTIGMTETPDGLAPSPGLLPGLLERFRRPGLDFDVVEFEVIDSSAIEPRHWNRIIAALAERYHDYDGFVVIHGTDTMAYTAGVLAFALRGLAKPVVLTGAQLPLLHRAPTAGTMSPTRWKRPASRHCTKSPSPSTACCCAYAAPQAGRRAFRRLWRAQCRAAGPLRHPPALEPGRLAARAGRIQALTLREDLSIACLFLSPGQGAALAGRLMADPALDAAVLMSYGSGNAPADPTLLAGVRALTARGGAVLNITQAPRGWWKWALTPPVSRWRAPARWPGRT